MLNKENIVPFFSVNINPKEVHLSELAKAISERQVKQALTARDKLFLKERNKIMRRLYSVAYSNYTVGFPVSISISVDSKMRPRMPWKGFQYRELNALKIYQEISSFLKNEGFSHSIKVSKREKGKEIELIITGVSPDGPKTSAKDR